MLKNLKSLREEAGISQKALADAIGVSQQSINKYENHSIEPDIMTMIQISAFFHTSVDYLIGNTCIRGRIEETGLSDLTASELQMLDHYRRLSDMERESIHLVIQCYRSNQH